MSLIVFFLYAQYVVGQVENIKKEISKIIKYDTDLDHSEIPGFSIGIIDGDSTFYIHFGSAKANLQEPMRKDLVFELGSVSKVFTSYLIHRLSEDGYFGINDLVNDLIPSEFSNPRLSHLTVWDLLNHRSGFPKLPAFFGRSQKSASNPYQHFQKDDLLTYYKDFIEEEDSKKFLYAHTNYAILELIAENQTERSYHDLLNDYVFSPLGMGDSFLDFPENRIITAGYDRAMRLTNPWSFSSFGASEGIKSTLEDVCTFIQNHMKYASKEQEIVMEKLLAIQSATEYNDKIYMANGWHVVKNGDFNIYTHTGKTSGHSCFVGFVRETKTGVAITVNSSLGTKDLGFLILRMINYNWKRDIHVR